MSMLPPSEFDALDQAASEGGEPSPPGVVGLVRVEQTGLAVVHEDEWIASTPESAAVLRAVAGDVDERAVEYSFPVEVHVIGTLTEAQTRALAALVFDELNGALRSLA
jgi:hypothetical protein